LFPGLTTQTQTSDWERTWTPLWNDESHTPSESKVYQIHL